MSTPNATTAPSSILNQNFVAFQSPDSNTSQASQHSERFIWYQKWNICQKNGAYMERGGVWAHIDPKQHCFTRLHLQPKLCSFPNPGLELKLKLNAGFTSQQKIHWTPKMEHFSKNVPKWNVTHLISPCQPRMPLLTAPSSILNQNFVAFQSPKAS